MEVPSPIDGILSEINSKDGETVEVGALLGSIQAGASLGSVSENVTQPTEKEVITKLKIKKEENNVVNLEIEKKQPKVFDEKSRRETFIRRAININQ